MLSVGCSTDDVHISVQLDSPLTVEGRAFPYDPIALFDSLPEGFVRRPEFPDTEAAIRSFEMPRTDQLDSLSTEWEATRDSVTDASERLFAMDRDSDAYRAGYEGFRELYSRLTTLSRNRNQLVRSLLAPQSDIAARAQAAADSLRLWEDAAYSALSETLARLTSERNPADFVVVGGAASVALQPGDWWITVRGRHPTNPFLEYFWNQPIRVSGIRRSYRVPLSPGTAIIRWRY